MEDPVYLYDQHVLDRMLESEQRQNLFKSYFTHQTHSSKLSSLIQQEMSSSANSSCCSMSNVYSNSTSNSTSSQCNSNNNNNNKQQIHHNKHNRHNHNHNHMSNNHTHSSFQQDFSEKDRRELAIWMNDVCVAEECQPDVFSLSILIVDKFLNFVKTKRQQLQLLGAVALLLASKLRQTSQIPAKHLIYYTQDSVSLQELKTWELFVLTTLKWDLTFITPVDFLDILLKRLTIKDEQIISDIEDQAHRLIIQCCFDFKHALYPPSMIAWACLIQAMEPWKLEQEKLHLASMFQIK